MTESKTTEDQKAQAFADALEAAFVAGFEAGGKRKPEEWLNAWTLYLTKGIRDDVGI